jgi:hypothetical protein
MVSFETIYRIPPSHVLKTRFHSYGDGVPARWTHLEFDEDGRFVARYESLGRASRGRARASGGWKKFDADGVLVASEDDLPL